MTIVKTSCRTNVAIVEASDENLSRAAKIIRDGGLVGFPTETVYGLGANALNPDAVQRIYGAKGRPSTSPLIVHVVDLAMARSLSSAWPEMAEDLALRYWPGPLTLVVPKASAIPDVVTAGLTSVGLRVPRASLGPRTDPASRRPHRGSQCKPFHGDIADDRPACGIRLGR